MHTSVKIGSGLSASPRIKTHIRRMRIYSYMRICLFTHENLYLAGNVTEVFEPLAALICESFLSIFLQIEKKNFCEFRILRKSMPLLVQLLCCRFAVKYTYISMLYVDVQAECYVCKTLHRSHVLKKNVCYIFYGHVGRLFGLVGIYSIYERQTWGIKMVLDDYTYVIYKCVYTYVCP